MNSFRKKKRVARRWISHFFGASFMAARHALWRRLLDAGRGQLWRRGPPWRWVWCLRKKKSNKERKVVALWRSGSKERRYIHKPRRKSLSNILSNHKTFLDSFKRQKYFSRKKNKIKELVFIRETRNFKVSRVLPRDASRQVEIATARQWSSLLLCV